MEDMQYRLIRFLEQAEGKIEDGRKLREEIARVWRQSRGSAKRWNLTVAMCARYQDGKSTTFNCFAGGRMLSTQGMGIRTSSCRVVLSHTWGREYAQIVWLTKEEQLWMVSRWLELPILPESWEKDGRALVQRAYALLREQEEDPQGFGEERGEALKNAVLLLGIRDAQPVRMMMEKSRLELSESKSVLAASTDEGKLWSACREALLNGPESLEALRQGVDSTFSWTQTVYLLVDEIRMYVHSPILRRLGVSVMDLPGLNVNSRDTELALDSLCQADVILYLFNGRKQTTDYDRRTLKLLKAAGLEHRVLFVVNFFTSEKKIRNTLEQTLLSELRALGYDSPPQLVYYNAFLAEKAMQGAQLLRRKLDEETAQYILAEQGEGGTATTVAEAWPVVVESVMRSVRAEGYRDVEEEGLTKRSVALVEQAGGWTALVDALAERVSAANTTSLWRRFVDWFRAKVFHRGPESTAGRREDAKKRFRFAWNSLVEACSTKIRIQRELLEEVTAYAGQFFPVREESHMLLKRIEGNTDGVIKASYISDVYAAGMQAYFEAYGDAGSRPPTTAAAFQYLRDIFRNLDVAWQSNLNNWIATYRESYARVQTDMLHPLAKIGQENGERLGLDAEPFAAELEAIGKEYLKRSMDCMARSESLADGMTDALEVLLPNAMYQNPGFLKRLFGGTPVRLHDTEVYVLHDSLSSNSEQLAKEFLNRCEGWWLHALDAERQALRRIDGVLEQMEERTRHREEEVKKELDWYMEFAEAAKAMLSDALVWMTIT